MRDIKSYWDECYMDGRDFRILLHESITRLLSYVDSDAEKTCLDIGCGTGQLTRELIHRGYRCTGIDVSPKAIGIASSLTVSGKARYVCLDIEQDTWQLLRQYGLITCKYVYAFISNKRSFLQEVAKHLKEGGIFFMVTPLAHDVPIEKRSIAVDFEQTMAELQGVFSTVDTFLDQGATCFVCIRSNCSPAQDHRH